MEYIHHINNSPEIMQEQHYENHMNHDEPCVVLIYASWCIHCKEMEPAWDNATHEMEQNVKVFKVESNDLPKHQHMLDAHNAHSNGYPTIYAFTPGKEPEYYIGERTSGGFISWVKNLFPSGKKKKTTKKKSTTKKKTTKKKSTKKKSTKKSGGYLKGKKKGKDSKSKDSKARKGKRGKGDKSAEKNE